jgi:membrane-bound lytic murein transglycosylase B
MSVAAATPSQVPVEAVLASSVVVRPGPLPYELVSSTELVEQVAGVSRFNRDAAPVQELEPLVVLRPENPPVQFDAKGKDLVQVSELGSFDVPEAALRAYKNAAAAMAETDPSCQIPWTLIAGIGRVESDHGRYGGSELGSDGVPRPQIRGIALDGNGVAAIHDTDNGRFDGDKVWDRAVGPMQFIPSTWSSAGRDGDGDGVADPNDIDDAALAAADYLCPASGSILDEAAMRAAILSYNHSDYYVALVEAFEQGYRTGTFTIPSPPPPPPAEDKPDGKKKKHGTDDPGKEDPGKDDPGKDESGDDGSSKDDEPGRGGKGHQGDKGGDDGSDPGKGGKPHKGGSGGTKDGSGGTGTGDGDEGDPGDGGDSGDGDTGSETPTPTPTPTPTAPGDDPSSAGLLTS